MSPLPRRCARALLGVIVVAGLSACSSSSKPASVASTTSSPPASTPPTIPPTTVGATDGPTPPDICAAYEALSQEDLRSVAERSNLANNWPALRAALAADLAQNQVLYGNIALAATGTVRSDAKLVAAFMPASRTLLLASTSLFEYQNGLESLPDDADVAQAAGRINDNAASTCNIQLVHPANP